MSDAATETKNAWHLAADVWQARALKAEAERDAALAAVERVRAIHYKREIWTGGGRSYWGCDIDKGSWPCPTIAALDGAPEPEWVEEIQYGHLTEIGFIQELRGENYARYKRTVRFGSALPVEGESKP